MEIKSSLFGKQTIDPDTIIHFPKGIPGFENETQFKLFHQADKPIIFWLQSVQDELLAFSVAPPSLFNINYNFMLSDAEESLLQIDKVEDVIILILLHKDENQDSHQPTIKGSIKSPLIINTVKRIGLQKVLLNTEQSITLTESSNQIAVSEVA